MIKARDAIATARSLLGTPYSQMDCIGLIREIIKRSPGGVGDYRCQGTNWLWDSIDNASKYRHLTWRQESLAGVKAGMLPFKLYGSSDVGHVGIATGEGTVIHSSSAKGRVVETPLTAEEGWDLLGIHRYIEVGETVEIEPEPEIVVPEIVVPEPKDEDPLYLGQIVTQKDPLRVRAYPKMGEILGHVPRGRIVEVLEVNGDGWPKIRYNELVGYASGDYIKQVSEDPVEPEPTAQFTTLINVVDGTQIVLGGDWREADD